MEPVAQVAPRKTPAEVGSYLGTVSVRGVIALTVTVAMCVLAFFYEEARKTLGECFACLVPFYLGGLRRK